MATLYTLWSPTPPATNTDIFDVLPGIAQAQFGLWAYATLAVLLALRLLLVRGSVQRWEALLWPSLLFAATFLINYRLLDEVSVNLKHVFNLFHHGRFSMAPDAMVDGTVEVPFYLAHLPFGFSPRSLLVGNMLLCALVGWLHLFALWRARLFEGDDHGLFPLALLALTLNFMGLFANGFGNGLLSLVFLLALLAAVRGKPMTALLWGGLLPLVRPDGLAWAGLNVLAVILLQGRQWRGLLTPRYLGAALLPILAAGIFYTGYKLFYGHWIPTPMLFKATAVGALSSIDLMDVPRLVATVLAQLPMVAVGVQALLVLAVVPLLHKQARAEPTHGPMRALCIYFLLTLPFAVMELTTHFTYANPIQRYYIVFYLCLALVVAGGLQWAMQPPQLRRMIAFFSTRLNAQRQFPEGAFRRLGFGLAGILVALVTYRELGRFDEAYEDPWYYNRTRMALAGAVTAQLAPPDFKLAASEMDTFGLMIDRPVIDLWGYSNRLIAASHACLHDVLKTEPTAWSAAKPDMYFMHWPTQFPLLALEPFEAVFATSKQSHGTQGLYNRLGPPDALFAEYDVVFANFPGASVAYLVKRTRVPELLARMRGLGFQNPVLRELDLRQVESPPGVLTKC